MVDFVNFDQSTVTQDNTGWVKWWLILQTVLIIAKYSIAKDMPWILVWLPTILVSLIIIIGILAAIILLYIVKK